MSFLSTLFGTAAAAASGPVAPVANLATSIINRVVPDKAAQEAAKAQLAEMALNGELQAIQGQIAINVAEAQNKSVWVAGWRPAFGWVGALGLFYEMFMRPLLTFITGGHLVAPQIEVQDLIALCTTMLGFGAMRSYDKTQGAGNGQ